MGLDLWFRADVARILQATHEAMQSTAAVMETMAATGNRPEDVAVREKAEGYRQGFGAALRAVATAFGLTESGGLPDRWHVAAAPETGYSGLVIDGKVAGVGDGNRLGRNGHKGLGTTWG